MSFSPPRLLSNGHVQTLWPALFPRKFDLPFERKRLELDDGDFLDLDWLRKGHRRLVVLSHGLEGCSEAVYMQGMAAAMSGAGWDVLAWNYRGCSGEPNRLLRSYHSGESGDLRTVVKHGAEAYDHIALAGFSLGGNITLKYLGEPEGHPKVRGGVAVSAPVDLAGSALRLDRHLPNRLYLRRFLASLLAKMKIKNRQFPGRLDIRGLHRIRSFREFDDRFTAPLHGFRDAADYWATCSSRARLPHITVPTLLINARNDPFLTEGCFPLEAAGSNPWLTLETPASGGHMGFVRAAAETVTWVEERTIEFLETSLLAGRGRTAESKMRQESRPP